MLIVYVCSHDSSPEYNLSLLTLSTISRPPSLHNNYSTFIALPFITKNYLFFSHIYSLVNSHMIITWNSCSLNVYVASWHFMSSTGIYQFGRQKYMIFNFTQELLNSIDQNVKNSKHGSEYWIHILSMCLRQCHKWIRFGSGHYHIRTSKFKPKIYSDLKSPGLNFLSFIILGSG